ncbi:MAG: hypothetical protein JWR80_183 [Bradyrhizobium sp.]|jgi:hypothetical protein|nr:hypothetical protein [Bradyrhizobium sp.]
MFNPLSFAQRKLPGWREAPIRMLDFHFAEGKRKMVEFNGYFFVTL